MWNETTIGKIVEGGTQLKKKNGYQIKRYSLDIKRNFQIAITLALGFFFRNHIALITDGVGKNKIQCVKPDFPTLVASAHYK